MDAIKFFFFMVRCVSNTTTAVPRMSKTKAIHCYVTVGTFAQRGLSSTAKTLRSLSGVRGSEY